MTSSDSTPDFSWLNKKDSAAEEDGNQDQAESTNQDTGSEDAGNAASQDPEVNPTAETWIQDSPDLPKPFIANPPIPADQSIHEVEAIESTGSDSVFDDDSEEVVPTSEEKNDATLIMPGRQLSETDNERLNASLTPEDVTVVLPTDTDSPKAEQTNLETFDSPETDDQEVSPEEEKGLNVDELDESEASASQLENESSTEVDSQENSNADEPTDPQTNETGDAAALDETPADDPSSPQQDEEKNSNTSFILLVSYASAMTLIALFLLMKGGSRPANEHLESLPDVAPEPEGELSYIPVHAPLPVGHLLKIGEKQRFGNIEVEPLRVVHEPIEFSHYNPSSKHKRPATQPVVKLWLKFTNVSENQEIAPLDGNLLLRWVTNSKQQREFSNQYLFAEGASEPEQEISTYRHSKTSDWDLRDQKLGEVLKPGESYETYIASTESLPEELPENLIWRVQFRKGFSPNGGGVTTVIDVAFQKDEMKAPEQGIKTSQHGKSNKTDSYLM